MLARVNEACMLLLYDILTLVRPLRTSILQLMNHCTQQNNNTGSKHFIFECDYKDLISGKTEPAFCVGNFRLTISD